MRSGVGCLGWLLVCIGCADVPAPIVIAASTGMWQTASELLRLGAPEAGLALRVANDGSALTRFCRGDADVAAANRQLTPRELRTCPPAHHPRAAWELPPEAIVLVHRMGADDWLDRLSADELTRLLASPGDGGVEAWAEVREGFPELPIHVIGPPPSSELYARVASAALPPGASIRTDISAYATEVGAIAAAASTPASVAFVGLQSVPRDLPVRLVPTAWQDPSHGLGEAPAGQPARPRWVYASPRALAQPVITAWITSIGGRPKGSPGPGSEEAP